MEYIDTRLMDICGQSVVNDAERRPSVREKMARFMMGRCGVDQLSRALTILSLVFFLLSFTGIAVFYWLAIVVLVIGYARIMSRNIPKRYQENMKYLQATEKLRTGYRRTKTRLSQRKVYRFYHCPSCRQTVRVPKGKGRIAITCPKCRTEFIKKS